jgi:hypothetical protein
MYVNFRSPSVLAQHAARHMIARGDGKDSLIAACLMEYRASDCSRPPPAGEADRT